MQILVDFFDIQSFIPHGYCLSWNSVLLWMHVTSDVLIALSYYSIPLSLFYFIRQRKVPYAWLVLMFGLFIVACGTTHLMSAVLIWVPLYWLDGSLKVLTAIISVATAIGMLRIIPFALKLPSVEQLQIEINERKNAQYEAQESSERLNKIANQLHSVVFQFRMRVDGSCCVPYTNRAFQQIFRFSPEEVKEDASCIFTVTHPDDLERLMESIHKSARELSIWQEEYRLKFPDGTERWLWGNATPQREADSSILWHGFVSDITKRKENENFLKESEARFRSIIDVSPVSLALNDNQQNVIFLNNAFVETFGFDLNDIPTLHDWWEKAYPDVNYRRWVLDTWMDRLKQCELENKIFTPIEITINCKNGKKKTVLASATPILNSFDLHLVMLFDITERKQMEHELQRSNSELEQFAYAISHDMRQPLRMVTTYLGLVEQALQTKLDDDTRQFLNFALDGAKRMDSMILSLLDYSRVGKQNEMLMVISTQKVLDEALLFLQPALEISGGEVEVLGEWIDLIANRDELTRLLQNLIGNALKYHEEDKLPHVKVSAVIKENKFHVEIQDNGIGIDPSQKNRLFKVFSRLQARSRYEGTGVGLALCRKIIEHHAGEIGVNSAGEGHGCVFWFEIPLIEQKSLT